jgi:hypothetical protein
MGKVQPASADDQFGVGARAEDEVCLSAATYAVPVFPESRAAQI